MARDLFVSYRRKDAKRVLPFAESLREHGLSVWIDQSEISEFAPITDEIRRGLAQSKALLAWYSEDYPKSRPCQMELTAAFLAAQHEGDPRRRVLVINPESCAAHIEPVELRDAQFAAAPSDSEWYAGLAERIAEHVGTITSPMGAILPIVPPSQYGLKLPGANRFVGRLPDLWRIHSALHGSESAIISGTSAPGLAQVSGLGGIGKSLLAEEYALRFGAAYPGGIFWLRALGNDPTCSRSPEAGDALRTERFGAIAMGLGIEIEGRDPRLIEGLLRAKLSDAGKLFLWIVDDLASGMAAEAVKSWLAPSPMGKTLVTTRSREYGAVGTPLRLDVLKPPEAFDLLCSRRKPESVSEETAARGIAEDLGLHPLAVDVAGAALAAQAGLVSFAEFRIRLADPTQDELELAADLADMLPSGHETSVATTLLRSVRGLPNEGQDFLRLASALAVAPIPPTLVAAAFLRADGLSEDEARRRASLAHAQVEKASLAERGEGNARLVHTLVSRAMRFHDTQPERTQALRAAVSATLKERLLSVADIRSHEVLAVEVIHARALCVVEPWDLDTASVGVWVARYDQERGNYGSARQLCERALGARRGVLGEEHPDTLACMNNLAAALHAQGDFDAAQAILRHVLATCQREEGDAHPNTLTAMNNIAEVLFERGDLASAYALEEQVLNAQRRTLGEEDPTTLLTMNNLASTLLAQGDCIRARALLEQALTGLRRSLGDDHSSTLSTMSNLTVVLGRLGDFVGARASQEQVLDARRRVLGEEHPDTLGSMSCLAEILRGEGNLNDARELQERVLGAQRRLLGEKHPDTLTSMNNLGGTLKAQRDLDGACALLEQALAGRRCLLGEEHPDTLASMDNLASLLSERGDLDGARQRYEWVMVSRRRVLGANHPDTIMSVANLASIVGALGEFGCASALQERGLRTSRRVLGEEHPHTVLSMDCLAVTLYAGGNFDRARTLQERVLDVRRHKLGEENLETLRAMNNLAATRHAQGDFEGAQALEEKLLALCQRTQGEEHFLTLNSMESLAATLLGQGDVAGARYYHECVMVLRRRVFGASHPDTLKSTANLASTLRMLGEVRRAKALEARVRRAGLVGMSLQSPD